MKPNKRVNRSEDSWPGSRKCRCSLKGHDAPRLPKTLGLKKMNSENILSNQWNIRWDDERKSLIFEKIEKNGEKRELIQIRENTFNKMTLEEASKFIGQRLILAIPSLREKYNKEFPFPDQ